MGFKINRKQNLIVDLILLFFSIIIFYNGITSLEFTSFTTNILKDLVNNWKTPPIIDIVESNGICPNGYEPFLNDTWPGVEPGCYCPGFVYDSLEIGRCSSKSTRSGCYTTSKINEINLNNWDGVLLCAKRSRQNYFDLISQQNTLGCAMGMKMCGILDDSVSRNRYCVKQNEGCFINQIKINNENTSGSLPLSMGKFFTFNTSQNGNLIIDLKTSQGDVCLDPCEKNMLDEPYKLLDDSKITYKCKNSIENNFFDDRYTLLDQTSLDNYYQYNRLDVILHDLELYPYPDKKEQIQLYYRGYLSWNSNCVQDDNLDPFKLIYYLEKIEKLNYLQKIIFYLSLVYLPSVVILVVMKLFWVFYEINDINAEKNLKIFDAINFVFLFVGILTCLLNYNTGSNLNNFFLAIKTSNCGDYITNKALYILGDKLESNISKNKYSTYLYIITLVLILTNLVLMLYNNGNNSQEPDSNNDFAYLELKDKDDINKIENEEEVVTTFKAESESEN